MDEPVLLPDNALVCYVTSSEWKYNDLLDVMGNDLPLRFYHMKLDLIEIQEASAIEIVKKKCTMAYEMLKKPVIVEDTSLCFNALHGLPGPYIKWFLQKLEPAGLFRLLEGWTDKTAYAYSCVAFYDGRNPEIEIFEGRMDGVIIPPQGEGGFGWDPCFSPNEGQTNLPNRMSYAEYPKDMRVQLSHRCTAFQKLKQYISGLVSP